MSLLLVALTSAALVRLVSDHVTRTAIDASVAADASLAQSFARAILEPSDMGPAALDPARINEIQSSLQSIIKPEGILRIKVFAQDGTVLFSDVPDLRGARLDVEHELAEAFEGEVATEITSGIEGEERDQLPFHAANVIEEYIPIREPDGTIHAVFEVYRDAAPLLAGVEVTQRDIVLVVVAAALALAIILQLVFRAAHTRLRHQTAALLESTRRDALTGLLNHGAVVLALAEFIEAAKHDGGAVGIGLVDIDNFRLLNDAHSHAAGDEALRQVARLLGEEVGAGTVIGRYGPDEFLIVAPASAAHRFEGAIRRLKTRLADLSLQFGASERLPLTVSAGLCSYPSHGDGPTELLAAATVALGEAKAGGGDAIRVAKTRPDELDMDGRPTFDVLQGLVVAVDTKDRYTKRHCHDVARYGLFLAGRAGLDADVRRTIHIAGLLHDVGKIAIPDAILRKPAALSADEYAVVKQHVALGDVIVRNLPNSEQVRAGVRHHHERWDGTGYLEGLIGEQIPLIARVLSIADAFSAMTSSRPYRKALTVKEALRRLEDAAGSQLDPHLVGLFVQGIETAPDAPLPGEAKPLPPLWLPRTEIIREVA